MNSADLIRAHGFAVVAVVLLVALAIAVLRVVALPLVGVAVLLDAAADKAATCQLLTDLASNGDAR